MKPRNTSAWLVLLSLLLATAAHAQFPGAATIEPYAIVSGGVGFPSTLEAPTVAPLPSPRVYPESGPDLAVGAGIGAVQGYLRYELRADYHRSKVDFVSPGYLASFGPIPTNPSGERIGVTTVLLMLGLEESYFHEDLSFYAMAGVGPSWGVIPIQGAEINDWEFGYAAWAGASWAVWKGLSVDLGYRYVASTDFSHTTIGPPAGPLQIRLPEFTYQASWATQEVMLSLRYFWDRKD